jgi:hypothetical protein
MRCRAIRTAPESPLQQPWLKSIKYNFINRRSVPVEKLETDHTHLLKSHCRPISIFPGPIPLHLDADTYIKQIVFKSSDLKNVTEF